MMFFKSRKAFEEEIFRRMNEEDDRRNLYRRLSELEDQVRDLTYRVARLEPSVPGQVPRPVMSCQEPPCREARSTEAGS